ncbi:MAG: glycosyltransferase family 2 protein [Halorientalis sp.]
MSDRMWRRWLDRAGFVGATAGVFLLGFVQGASLLTIRLDLAVAVLVVVLLEAVLSSVGFAAFVTVSTLAFLAQLRSDPSAVRTDGPSVIAVVPVYRDADVLERSVRSLLGSGYANLEIAVVCEPDDAASKRRAAELATHDRVTALVNTRYPGSKAGAINYAVEQTESAHVGVFDADELVHPEFVGAAVADLADCDVVQGRTVPQPTGLVEELAYYESVLLGYVSSRLLTLLTGFRMAVSRAVVVRREPLECVGGYDEAMLTEDFRFAFDCYTEGLDVREELARPSRIEAAHSLSDWWGQRKRWMTGYAQVLHRLVGDLWPPAGYRDVTAAALCGGIVAGSLFMLSLLAKFGVLVLVGAQALVVAPVAAVVAVTGLVRVHDWRTGAVDGLGWAWLLVPLVFPLYSLTAIKAVVEYLSTWDGGWYRVEKEG